MFRRFLKTIWRFRRTAPKPLISVRIHRGKLLKNLHKFQKLCRVAPVLKSNAYGHGLVEVAGILARESVPFLCVDSYFEVRVLREAGITAPLLVIGYSRPEYIIGNHYSDVSFAVTTLEQLELLKNAGINPSSLHIKIDTGMHRQGLDPREIPDPFTYAGLMSHLADADNPDTTSTRKQIGLWNNIIASIRGSASNRYIHLAATAGSRFHKSISENVMRIGLGLYQNTLSMHSIVTGVRDLKPGDAVGYNRTFIARENMKIATVPAGYFEGVDRRLSNRGVFMIGDNECPIIGRVSMNITTIDVTNMSVVKMGTPVTIISDNPNHKNSIENIAKLCGTIPYEILVHIAPHLSRTVI